MKLDIDLEESVAFYEAEVERIKESIERQHAQLRGAERDLEIAKNFLELERRRHTQAAPMERTLREAAIQIVREKGRVTAAEIVDTLTARGFKFDTASPGRAIHTALMRAPVRKVAPNTYEIEEGRLL